MPKIQIIGQVLPLALNISVNTGADVEWNDPDIGLEISFSVQITNSLVTVTCDVNRLNDNDLNALYMRVHDIVQASVNLVAFCGGFGCVVYLHTLVMPDGTPVPIFFVDKRLPPLCTAFGINSEAPDTNASFDVVYKLVLQEPALFMALNDLIVAITAPHQAPVNCARAIEGIRHMISPPGTLTKDTWRIMRDNLRLERSYIELITDTSAAPRHGDRAHIPGSIVTTICERAWVIMNRFLEYRKRGNQQLPTSEFPLLVS